MKLAPQPTEHGWYAVCKMYDLREGAIINAIFFDGEWRDTFGLRGVIYKSPMAFATQEEALDWGERRDPENTMGYAPDERGDPDDWETLP